MTTYTAILHKEEDMYIAKCPEIGTVSQGKSIEEAIANLKEATKSYIKAFPPREAPHAVLSVFEVADPLVQKP